jgi:hypothetical protein
MRRFSFAQMGTADHAMLFAGGSIPTEEDLLGAWQLDAIATSNQLTGVARLQFDRTAESSSEKRVRHERHRQDLLLPHFVTEHFQERRSPRCKTRSGKSTVSTILGRWTTDIAGRTRNCCSLDLRGCFTSRSSRAPRAGSRCTTC